MYPHIFKPIKINSLTLKNRIVMAPMGTNFGAGGGKESQEHIDHYVERVLGKVGLIITEAMTVHASNIHRIYALNLTSDDFIGGLSRLTARVHEAGGKIAAQLIHAGRVSGHQAEDSVIYAPSPIPHQVTGVIPKEMTIEEIKDVVASFGAAAQRAVQAGFDAVEIHGAHGYLIMEFLSPLWNKRADIYGGSFSNRARFALEIVSAIRKEVGPDFPVIFRLSAEELIPGGVPLEESLQLAGLLEREGINALHVSAGNNETPQGMGKVIPTLYIKPGHLVQYAASIKSAVNIPVITVGRINTPAMAEAIIKEGQADMVALGRSLYADPEWVAKASAGEESSIVKCIACNAGCIERLNKQLKVTCVQNTRLGNNVFKINPAGRRKEVLVIGAGPAGLETAAIAAERGHQVRIWEKEPQAGGQVSLAAKAPSKKEFQEVILSRIERLNRHGVTIELNKQATEASVVGSGFKEIIIATGAVPVMPKASWAGAPIVMDAWSALKENVFDNSLKRVVVVGGGSVGLETAHTFAEKGSEVIVIELASAFGSNVVPTVRAALLEELRAAKVNLISQATVTDVKAKRVMYEKTGQTSVIDNVDLVLVAVGSKPENSLANLLMRHDLKVWTVGDCSKPGTILDAVMSSFQLGMSL